MSKKNKYDTPFEWITIIKNKNIFLLSNFLRQFGEVFEYNEEKCFDILFYPANDDVSMMFIHIAFGDFSQESDTFEEL